MPFSSSRLPEFAFDSRWRRATFWFLAITTALRLLQLSGLELAPDEAYYWDWSRRLSLGYYDQGPMIAYVIRLTTLFFGTGEFGVRFGVLAASLGTLLCCARLAERLFSPLTGFLTALLLGISPLMEVGSLIATYDPLLVFFWALTLVCLERAVFAEDARQQRIAWLWAGVATGLGFLSKHTMLLILPCLLSFLLLSKSHRPWLRRPEPYLAFLLTLALYGGVFYWNAHHDWWTFRHLIFLTRKSFGSPLRRFGDFLGSQALLLGPLLFLQILWSVLTLGLASDATEEGKNRIGPFPLGRGVGVGRVGANEIRLFLLCMGLPVFLFFCLMTLKAKVQGNWAPCAWLSLSILCAGQVTGWLHARPRHAKRWLAAAVATGVFLTIALISPPLRTALGVKLPPDADISNQAYGWRETMQHVQRVRAEMERSGNPIFLAGNGYQYPALMGFYLPDRPETFDLFLHYRLTMYAATVERLRGHLGQNAVFVNENESEDAYLRDIFERVEWEKPIPIYRRPYSDEPIRVLHIARCYGFRKYVGLDWAEGG